MKHAYVLLSALLCTLVSPLVAQNSDTTARDKSSALLNQDADKNDRGKASARLNQSFRFSENVQEFTTDFVVPLKWLGSKDSPEGLIFLDPRASFTENIEQEVNIGLGARKLFDCEGHQLLMGANVFYDSRWTSFNNQYDQVGVGVELLTDHFDLRGNYYDAENKKFVIEQNELVTESSRSSTSLSDPVEMDGRLVSTKTTRTTTTTTRRFFERFEVPLDGYDVEAGVKLPTITDWLETRVYIGGYDFDDELTDRVAGYKGRVEMRLPYGLTIDGEWYEDKELYGIDYFVGCRLHLDIDADALKEGRNPFRRTPIHTPKLSSRLMEQVMRDPHVQVGVSALVENESSSSTSASTTTTEEQVDLGPAPPPPPAPVASPTGWASINPMLGDWFIFKFENMYHKPSFRILHIDSPTMLSVGEYYNLNGQVGVNGPPPYQKTYTWIYTTLTPTRGKLDMSNIHHNEEFLLDFTAPNTGDWMIKIDGNTPPGLTPLWFTFPDAPIIVN